MGANTAQKAIMAGGEDFARRKPAPESLTSSDQAGFEHSLAGIALEKAYQEIHQLEGPLYEENLNLERERDHLRLLLEVNNVVVSTVDLHELLRAISTCLRPVISHDYASLVLYEPESQQLRLRALDFAAGKDFMQEDALVPLEDTPIGLAFRSRQPVLISQFDLRQFPSEFTRELMAAGLNSGCCLPLISPGRISGVLNVASLRENAFTKADLELLGQVAKQTGIAIENTLSLYQIVELHNKLVEEKVSLQEAYAQISKLKEQLYKENLALREEIDQTSMFEEIVGSSKPVREVLKQVEKVAPSDSTVLILGETGTGKELVARALHRRSKRASRAFVRVNCAAIPQSLIASELFGHEKGAFTGALQRRVGRFEAANGGTLFLDEIGELPMETQIALLRVLQEKEFERVGSNQPISVDVRLIAATNRDLSAAVSAGTFRQDLFYRLNVVPVAVPPLRGRAEDIPLLVEYFVGRYANAAGKKIRHIGKGTLEALKAYRWPGNIRELQNVVERAVTLSETDTFVVDETWLKPETVHSSEREGLSALADRELEIIQAALAESHGRISGPSGAAAKLGIPRQTLESKIRRLGLGKYEQKPPTTR